MGCRILWIIVVVVCAGSIRVSADEKAPGQGGSHKQDEQAIRKATDEYVAALARGDLKALAELWTTDGDFVDDHGRAYPARELIEADAKAGRTDPRPDININPSSLRFLSADVAIEDGTSEVAQPLGKGPARGRFTTVWVKKDGRWRMAALREGRIDTPATAARLADLDWMTGEWVGKSKDTTIEISAQWNPTGTFLVREMQVVKDGESIFSGTQRIGWDPLTQKIKSWMFDSAGGHGEGVWHKSGESWTVDATGVLPDGGRTSSTNVYTPDGPDSFTWKSSAGRTRGEPVPNIEIKLTRKAADK